MLLYKLDFLIKSKLKKLRANKTIPVTSHKVCLLLSSIQLASPPPPFTHTLVGSTKHAGLFLPLIIRTNCP